MYTRIPAFNRVAAVARARASTPTRYARYSSTMHDNDPETLDLEKARNLAGTQHKTSTPHKQHAPGWNEHLASASEASVKADKTTGSPDELQKTTIEYIQSRHSPDEASYLRDEVNGPLSSAQSDDRESHPQVLVKKTVTEEVWKTDKNTASEDIVKAERGVLSTE
ncbi:hypothetical protein GGX14DRAFT_418832 [Mycena pura]|uniref:Uncharacterized protein n=1 Tax=Mycena pura TaxID=153505 RepID=A0AAD6YRM0_9AGAR|nr:hypothetical protein GGX14DRAFT_418832 [Mycena pura]